MYEFPFMLPSFLQRETLLKISRLLLTTSPFLYWFYSLSKLFSRLGTNYFLQVLNLLGGGGGGGGGDGKHKNDRVGSSVQQPNHLKMLLFYFIIAPF